ncbi:hypothetical protein FQA39_LY10008 [Lamprigera yunnana]|nr:hypothetical protein FQA39_LY10008 [Lamprigera yunnana]
MPKLLYRLGAKFTPTNVNDYFSTVIKDYIKNREANNIVRSDMIQLLVEARKNPNKMNMIADDKFDGFDSASTLMCFMAHELAVNVDIQERLQSEIDDALNQHDDNLSYETLSKMNYMNMVVSETLTLTSMGGFWLGIAQVNARTAKFGPKIGLRLYNH